MLLEVRHLRIIEAISRAGTVSRAASLIYLTQPAVSHALRDLEDRLGVSLFHRSRSGMVPTTEGERLLRAATVVLEEIRRAEHDIGQMRQGQRGVLYLTTECYTCYHWLPVVLSGFRKRYPEIDVEIVPEATNDPLDHLLTGRVDVAIVHRSPNPETIATETLFRDELVLVVPKGHRLARRRVVNAQDFAEETLVLHSNPASSVFVTDVLVPAGVTPGRTLQLGLTEAVLEMVRAGMGVTVMARWAVQPALETGALSAVRVTRAGIFRTWYAAYRVHRSNERMLQTLIEQLRANALWAAERCTLIA